MELEFGYDTTVQHVTVPEERLLAVLEPQGAAAPAAGAEEDIVRAALANPIGAPALRAVGPARGEDRHRHLGRFPPHAYLEGAAGGAGGAVGRRGRAGGRDAGVRPGRPPAPTRRRSAAVWPAKQPGGRSPASIPIRRTPSPLASPRRGTPVEIMRAVAEADRRILLGNIEFHYFAGFSGGAKALMPGVSTRAAIRCNHSHMAEPGAKAGVLEGNPVREDLEEAAAIVGADYIVNVVLDAHKHIVHAVGRRCDAGPPGRLRVSGEVLPRPHPPPRRTSSW